MSDGGSHVGHIVLRMRSRLLRSCACAITTTSPPCPAVDAQHVTRRDVPVRDLRKNQSNAPQRYLLNLSLSAEACSFFVSISFFRSLTCSVSLQVSLVAICTKGPALLHANQRARWLSSTTNGCCFSVCLSQTPSAEALSTHFSYWDQNLTMPQMF